MDKLKNMLGSSKTNDDSQSGQGSHFSNSRQADATSATGPMTSGADSTGSSGLHEPHASRMPGGFDDDAATTASVKSGIPGQSQTGSAYTGPSSNDNGLSSSSTTQSTGLGGSSVNAGNSTSQTGGLTGSSGSAGYSSMPTVAPSGTAHSTTAGTSSGLSSLAGGSSETTRSGHGLSQPLTGSGGSVQQSGYTAPGQIGTYPAGAAATSKPSSSLQRDANQSSLPSSNATNFGSSAMDTKQTGLRDLSSTSSMNKDPATANEGSSTTSGGHSFLPSSGNQTSTAYDQSTSKTEPTSISNTHGMTGLMQSNKTDATPSTTGLKDNSLPSTGQTGAMSSQAPQLSGSNTTTGTSSSTSRNLQDAAVAHTHGHDSNTTTGASNYGMGYGPDSWQHDHGTHGHNYDGDPCSSDTVPPGGPSFADGPHALMTANMLDPSVGKTRGSLEHASAPVQQDSSTLSTAQSGSDTTQHGHTTSTTTNTRGFASGQTTGTSLATGNTSSAGDSGAHRGNPDASMTGPAPSTAGPHKSDILNKMDPRVDSDLSKQNNPSTQTMTPSGTLEDSTSASSRDRAVVSGSAHSNPASVDNKIHSSTTSPNAATASGHGAPAAYEDTHNKHMSQTQGNVPSSTTNTVKTALGMDRGLEPSTGPAKSTTAGHDSYRDPALSSVAAAGVAGPAAYEGVEQRGSGQANGQAMSHTQSSATPSATNTAHETSRNPQSSNVATGGFGSSSTSALGDRRGEGASYTGESVPNSSIADRSDLHRHQESSNTGSGVPSYAHTGQQGSTTTSGHQTGTGFDPEMGTGHHYGRDAGLAGAGAAAATGVHEAPKHIDGRPGDSVTKQSDISHSSTGQHDTNLTGPTSSTGHTTTGHHTGLRSNQSAADTGISGTEASHGRHENTHGSGHLDRKHDEHSHHHESHPHEHKPSVLDRMLHRHKDETTDSTKHNPTGLEDRMADTHLDQAGTTSQGPTASSMGSGNTTHDAYHTTEGHNRLHKDPPGQRNL